MNENYVYKVRIETDGEVWRLPIKTKGKNSAEQKAALKMARHGFTDIHVSSVKRLWKA